MALIGKIRTRSGLRFTSPADSLSIDVEAYATVGDGISRVGFQIFPETGMPGNEEKWARELRFPNYSSESPLPGAAGGMAPLYCFGCTLNADEWPGGWIRVQPYVISDGGAPRLDLDSIWVLNDSDGVNRRGSGLTIYAHAQNGNDGNSGGELSPVATLQRAIDLCRKLPGGDISSLVDMNAGGSKIIAEGTFSGVRSGGVVNWHSGNEWVTIEAGPAGARLDPADSDDDWLRCSGVQSASTKAQLKIVGFEMRGTLQLLPSMNSNTQMNLWLDRCTMHNPHWDPAKRWSVRYRESQQKYGYWIPSSGNPRGDLYASCCTYLGVNSGPSNFRDVQDLDISDWTAISIECNGEVPDASATNLLIRHQRYTSPDVWGYIDTEAQGNLTLSVPTPGTLRIDATGPLYQNGHGTDTVNLGTLQEITNNPYWQVQLTGFGGPNDGLRAVTAAGIDFVELDVPGATVASPAATARIMTWGTGLIFGSGGVDLSYEQLVHPDILWLGSLQGSVFSNISTLDIKNAQGIFGSSSAKSLCVFYNINAGENNSNNMAGSPLDQCILAHCSFDGPTSFNPNTTDCRIINNAWRQVSNLPDHGVDGNDVNSNHSINGPAQGLHGSAGPFFKYDPSDPPYSYEPLGLWHEAGVWADFPPNTDDYYHWPNGEAPPIGSLTNVALHRWDQATGTIGGTADGGSSASLELNVRSSLTGTAAGTSSAALDISENQALFGVAQGRATASLTLEVINGVSIGPATAPGSSTATGSLTPIRGLAGTAPGTSSAGANLYTPGTVDLEGVASGSSLALASITLFKNASDVSDPSLFELMKQRIHNALRALVDTGAFHPCRTNPQTGQMTIDLEKTIKPTGVAIKELRASFQPAARLRSAFNVSELRSWTWIARVTFNTEVACEVFEENAIAAGIKIPPIVGIPAQRTLLARLADSDYSHGPEQSPSTATTVDFIFEVIPETLRK